MLLEGRQVFCSAARQGSSFKPGFEPRRLVFCMQPAPIAGICTLERCCSSFPALLLPLQDFTSAHNASNDSGTGTPVYCPVCHSTKPVPLLPCRGQEDSPEFAPVPDLVCSDSGAPALESSPMNVCPFCWQGTAHILPCFCMWTMAGHWFVFQSAILTFADSAAHCRGTAVKQLLTKPQFCPQAPSSHSAHPRGAGQHKSAMQQPAMLVGKRSNPEDIPALPQLQAATCRVLVSAFIRWLCPGAPSVPFRWVRPVG